ncbi:unnamed protein product [Tetraodon nigroviridis]|uniref:(spotted green pufferfish) hypothetical protein n=1 Tax=Tetraodon nigroviridis TaxID=99883 RepID=Q4THR1_TETNG|nr:unnamed protein product [Tetraodon nigroviridis]
MDHQKEALRRIISTLSNKNEELEHFLESVDHTLTGLQVRSEGAGPENLIREELTYFRGIRTKQKGLELRDVIREETQRKEAELQKQLSEGTFALRSCEQLLEFAHRTLSISDEEEFLKAAKQIKERFVELLLGFLIISSLIGVGSCLGFQKKWSSPPPVARVTMAPAFRLSTRLAASENMSQYTVDFSAERAGLQRLHFLPGESGPGCPAGERIPAAFLLVRTHR